MSDALQIPRYEDIGVRPFINCVGTITTLSGSLALPQVRQAMTEAAQHYVIIDELMEGVGARIAQLMQCEWGLVTAGCAAALSQVTAACITGDDADKRARLPDTTGLKNEVIVPSGHRMGYERAVSAVGTRFVEVATEAELEAAYNDRTAMIFVFGDAAERGAIDFEKLTASGRAHGVPIFVDAAAERPDAPNWYLERGADAVAYSGGKCLRGPQVSGLVLGRKDLLQAAFANGCPHGSIGRPMKVGKEEIMGLLAAVEQWMVRDHQAEWREWERRLEVIAQTVEAFPSVTTSIRQPGRSNVAPHMTISWDPDQLGIDGATVSQQLAAGQPRIEMRGGNDSLSINPYMMEDGEEIPVARRLQEVLSA
ncbi:MAG: aminotransferase class V-fold PLP-dependent enzyme [Candidatus Latescibacteria bacterium]|nr:aminotransferase class V-fold PLP-dependent enzyme [Candidatus Latescibacterota bacterium]